MSDVIEKCPVCKQKPTVRVGSNRIILMCNDLCDSTDNFVIDRNSPSLSSIPHDARKLIGLWNKKQQENTELCQETQ